LLIVDQSTLTLLEAAVSPGSPGVDEIRPPNSEIARARPAP
jgi:hypothetical protein